MPDDAPAPVTAEDGQQVSDAGDRSVVTAEGGPALKDSLTTEGLRERLAEAATRWALMYPIASWRLAEDDKAELLAKIWGDQIANAVIAELAGDPGDLPKRLAEALKRFFDDPPLDDGPEEFLQAAGRAVMAVRWEDHAATLAKLEHALAELASLRDHRARWQTEHERAERAKAEIGTLTNRVHALEANGAELLHRTERAEAANERVRAQGTFWAVCAAETVAAFGRGVLATLDATESPTTAPEPAQTVRLVIENAAPLGPAHTITLDHRRYTVVACVPTDHGMTETYELQPAGGDE